MKHIEQTKCSYLSLNKDRELVKFSIYCVGHKIRLTGIETMCRLRHRFVTLYQLL